MVAKSLLSGLCFTLAFSNFGIVSAADSQTLIEKRIEYNLKKEDILASREYAVALSQNGYHSESLEIFKQLHVANPNNNDVIFDYIVVLVWAGKNQEAIALFEKVNGTGSLAPLYVKVSVAGSYYQTGNYQVASQLFHEGSVSGHHKAQIWEAQSLIRAGESEAGYRKYSTLLEKNPQDIDVYLSRASQLMLASQHTAAIADLEKALSLIPVDSDSSSQRRKIHYDMAVSYVRAGEEGRAIPLLKPYIQDGTADIWMQSDYITALRLSADYKMAISEGERLWTEYEKVPLFGLQALGDSYLRNGQAEKAMPIYQVILKRDPDSVPVKLGLAYSYMAQGNLEKVRSCISR